MSKENESQIPVQSRSGQTHSTERNYFQDEDMPKLVRPLNEGRLAEIQKLADEIKQAPSDQSSN
jgi:hypothetical protein